MSIVFLGQQDFTQVADPSWRVGSFGEDTCTIPWRGPRPTRAAFEQALQLQRWNSLSGFPRMYLKGWSSSSMDSYAYPTIELEFVGFRSGIIPIAQSVDGTSFQSASGSGTIDDPSNPGNPLQVSGSISYMASRTTWTWFETQEPPTTARYNSVRSTSDPLSNIVQYRINPTGTTNAVPYAAFVAIFNSFARGIIVSEYQRTLIVPKTLWACTSIVDWKVING